jgi:hypothetical protein
MIEEVRGRHPELEPRAFGDAEYLNKPKSMLLRPGPTITPRALLPKRPFGGTANAAGSNHG